MAVETRWFYVHNYGQWHIAHEAEVALCGVEKDRITGHWASRMHFRDYDPRIEADERQVCALCLLALPVESPNRETGDNGNG